MICPNCQQQQLKTQETFQLPEQTIRVKKCPACAWKFTTREFVSEDEVIPQSVRDLKRRKKK